MDASAPRDFDMAEVDAEAMKLVEDANLGNLSVDADSAFGSRWSFYKIESMAVT